MPAKQKTQTTLFHTPNIWKGRDAYIAAKAAKKPVGNLIAGKYRTGPPLSVVNVILRDISCSTDHVGTSINIEYRVTYYGTFDPVYITGNAGSLGLPWYGDYASGSDSLVYCSNTECKWFGGQAVSTELPGAFDYTAKFSPITPERYDLSPLDRPALIEFGGTDLTEIRRYDYNGNAIVNSAGDYYEGLPEFYVPGFEVNISYNVSSNPSSLIQTYSFSTNSATWNSQAANSGAIGKINAVETFETYQGIQIQFWRMTVPIRFRTDGNGWTFAPFDYGYRYLESGQPVNYTDPNTGVYGPVFLDGSGNLLGGDGSTLSADPVIYPAASGDTPAGYQILNSVDWNDASFPNPFA